MQRIPKWLWLHLKQRRLGSLEITAFVIGYILMAFELAASRILAPTIGSSTYVWTSVIGVIIGALALGYASGGWLADKRVRHTDVAFLLLASSVAMLLCIVTAEASLATIADYIRDGRLRGLVASLLLFAPASFIIGAISPYLVRLHTVDLTQAGRSVASLSALNAIGGIVGTFSVGFFFFGYIGSRQTVLFLCLLALAASWIISPRQATRRRFYLSGAVLATCSIALLPVQKTNAIEIDSATAHYQVITTKNSEGQAVRYLVHGNEGIQSGVLIDNPTALTLDYSRNLAAATADAPHKKRILVLGGGAFVIPGYLARTYPASTIDVVEIDPKLVEISKQYFYLQEHPNLHIYEDDARSFLQDNRTKYDLIIVDVFSELSVPFTLTTAEYAAQLSRSLQPQGTVLVNSVLSPSDACYGFTSRLLASYTSSFSQQRAFGAHWHVPKKQNVVLAYSNHSLSWLRLSLPEITAAMPQEAAPLTDDNAPVERLQFNCR